MESQKIRLFISAELRRELKRLIALFATDMWEMKIRIISGFPEQIPTLIGALRANAEGRGTQITLNKMRDACTPTDWLVTFLTSCKTVVKDAMLIEFIQDVINTLNTIYELIGPAHTHYRWESQHEAEMYLKFELQKYDTNTPNQGIVSTAKTLAEVKRSDLLRELYALCV